MEIVKLPIELITIIAKHIYKHNALAKLFSKLMYVDKRCMNNLHIIPAIQKDFNDYKITQVLLYVDSTNENTDFEQYKKKLCGINLNNFFYQSLARSDINNFTKDHGKNKVIINKHRTIDLYWLKVKLFYIACALGDSVFVKKILLDKCMHINFKHLEKGFNITINRNQYDIVKIIYNNEYFCSVYHGKNYNLSIQMINNYKIFTLIFPKKQLTNDIIFYALDGMWLFRTSENIKKSFEYLYWHTDIKHIYESNVNIKLVFQNALYWESQKIIDNVLYHLFEMKDGKMLEKHAINKMVIFGLLDLCTKIKHNTVTSEEHDPKISENYIKNVMHDLIEIAFVYS